MRVENVMSRPVISVEADDSLDRCAQRMFEVDVGFVVVMEGEHMVGVLTDRDICMAAYTRRLPLADIAADEVMSRNVSTVGEGESLDAAERLMADRKVRRLPVIDGRGSVVGVLSIGDVAREADYGRSRTNPEVEPELVSHTLGTICEPHPEPIVPTSY